MQAILEEGLVLGTEEVKLAWGRQQWLHHLLHRLHWHLGQD